MDKDTELRVMLYSKISFKLFQMMIENNEKKMINMETLIRNNAEAEYGCPVAYTYTFDEIRELVGGCGINIEKIWKTHIFSYDIDNYKKNIYVKNNYWDGVDDKIFKIMEKELGWHTLFIANLTR
jgi:hypothetical protein